MNFNYIKHFTHTHVHLFREMPTQNIQDETMVHEIKVKTVYSGEVMIHYIEDGITYEDLCKEIRGICRFSPDFKVNIYLDILDVCVVKRK